MTSQQPTGHDQAVEWMSDVLGDLEPCEHRDSPDWPYHPRCDAPQVLAALRAALAAGDPDVAEALGMHRRVMWDDNRSDRKGEAVWFQTTPVWTWTEVVP